MLGFDVQHMLDALAISGSHAAGLAEYTRTGGSVKRIHSAIPTQAGVRSALFAAAGITGPYTVLEGEKGFCKVFAGSYDTDRMVGGLGSTYHLRDTGLKPHACPHVMQAALDALDNVRAKSPLPPDRIKAITVYASEFIISHTCAITEPTDVLSAQFSMPFSLAMRLHHGGTGVRGGNGFWDYPNIDIKDEKLLATARKIKAYDAQADVRVKVAQGVGLEIETVDGQRMVEIVEHSKGLPENPLTPDEVREKFLSLVEPVLPPDVPRQIIKQVDAIDNAADMTQLMRLLVVAPPQRRIEAA
jgi:2-methylcitrate dehydratase PrpD